METGMRLRIKTSKGRVKTATVSKCDIECIESTESGIPVIDSTPDSRIYEVNSYFSVILDCTKITKKHSNKFRKYCDFLF